MLYATNAQSLIVHTFRAIGGFVLTFEKDDNGQLS